MRVHWKRVFNEKKYNFDCHFIISGTINGNTMSLPAQYLEKEYLQEAVQSVIEEFILDTNKRNEKVKRDSEELDIKTRVRNHFRNIANRKKFYLMKDYIKYLSDYYGEGEMRIYEYLEDDIEIVKKTNGIK